MTSSAAVPGGARTAWPMNETVVALAAWGVLTWSGVGSRPVSLGAVDPANWFPGRGLTLAQIPLVAALVLGGIPLVWDLLTKLVAGTFGSDLLAGISIVTSVLLGEYVAGVLVVLMLSGGAALESRASQRPGQS